MPLTLTQITDLLTPIVQEQDKQKQLDDDKPAPEPAPEEVLHEAPSQV